MIDLGQILKVPHIDYESGFDISPDGSNLAFSWNLSGQWQIYILSLAEHDAQVMQISSGPAAHLAPRYSPKGDYLYFLRDTDGGEVYDLIRFELSTRELTNLTPDTLDSLASEYAISPDGKQAAILSDRGGNFDLYLVPTTGGEPRLLYACGKPLFGVAWSPSGDWLAVTGQGKGQDTNIIIVPVDGAPSTLLADGAHPLNAKEPCWALDGKYLIFAAERNGIYQLAIYALADHTFHWLVNSPGDKGQPDWSPNGKQAVYTCAEGPLTKIALLDLRDWVEIPFEMPEAGLCAFPKWSPDGRKVIFAFESPRLPADLWIHDTATGQNTQITRSLPAELNPNEFILPQHITYPSLDGTMVPALLFLPDSKTINSDAPVSQPLPPAVVVPHGGPSWLFGFLWYPIFQHMVSRGWVVLAPNYRGSTGYGREWQLANRFRIGDVDTMDVTAGADFLVRSGLADKNRIAITGRSHGGYLTLSCMTRYPDRWAGGSAVVPFINYFTSHQNLRSDLKAWDIENMGDPQENYQRWVEASPYFYLENLNAPIQLICGANDPRCPANDSEEAYEKMLALGKKAELLLYPDEGHAFLKTENVVDHELKRIAFIAGCFQ